MRKMPSKSRDDGLGLVHYDSDYHHRSWVEFTTLTETEYENLKDFYKVLDRIKNQTRQFT